MVLTVLKFQSPSPSDQRKCGLSLCPMQTTTRKVKKKLMPPLAAKDRLSFHQIAQSNFYQRFHAREEAHSTQLPHLTIPPTSVESEKTFSASGLFLTKLRCRLSDTSLCSYFKILFFRSETECQTQDVYCLVTIVARTEVHKYLSWGF